jgi:hypothetical protein
VTELGAGEPSVGERIEHNGVAQLLIAIGLVLLLLAQVVAHLPESSAVEDELGGTGNYLVRLAGVETQWGVFAPNPRSTSIAIEGRVTFDDGATATWSLPQGGRIGDNLRYYRWRKWLERARSDDHRNLWEPTCQWIASLYEDHESPVTQVQLVRFVRDNRVVGPQPPYSEFVYHTCTPEASS